MSYLSPPREPMIDAAFQIARPLYHGQLMQDKPILLHTVKVAKTYEEHDPNATPEIFAGLLLHDTPDFVSNHLALKERIISQVSLGSWALVNTIIVAHEHMSQPDQRLPWQRFIVSVASNQPDVLAGMAADEIVSVRQVLQTGEQAPDQRKFWAERHRFVNLVPFFRDFSNIAQPVLAAALAQKLEQQVSQAEQVVRDIIL